MVFMLESGETIIFKHRCKLSNVSGELLVTNLRLAWTPSIPKEATDFQSPWSNIKNMVFSPPTDPKVATKVDTLFGAGSGGKGLVFFLEGSEKEKELLRLKAEFKKIRSANSLAAAPAGAGGGPSSALGAGAGAGASGGGLTKKRSAAQMLVDEGADSAQREARLKQRKASLLAADQQLAKSYRELVETSKIVSVEEFWSLYVDPSLLEDKELQVQRQGRLTITDIIKNSTKQTADGLTSISLNKDDRQSILDSDPAARRAYEELVPLQKSEGEFWVLYFEKWINGLSPQAEELFARFQDKNIVGGAGGGGSGGGAGGAAGAATLLARSKQLQQGVDLEFNLLKNYSDYHTSENLATEDRLHELKQDVLQLNSESQRVMAPLRNSSDAPRAKSGSGSGSGGGSSSGSGSSLGVVAEYRELLPEKKPDYMPLRLASAQQPDSSSSTSEAAPVKQSAFGKASSSVARGAARRPPYVPQSAIDIEFDLWKAFPRADRANVLFVQDRTTLRAVALQQMAGLQGIGVGSAAAASAAGAGADAGHGSYEDFKQDMLEAFVEVTELLRHFFSILSREGAQAPRTGTEAAVKVGKLVDRLSGKKEQLVNKSKVIRETKRFADHYLDASTAVIGDITKLITRAVDWWAVYSQQ